MAIATLKDTRPAANAAAISPLECPVTLAGMIPQDRSKITRPEQFELQCTQAG